MPAHAADTLSCRGAGMTPEARTERVRLDFKTTIRALYGHEITSLQYWQTVAFSRKAAL